MCHPKADNPISKKNPIKFNVKPIVGISVFVWRCFIHLSLGVSIIASILSNAFFFLFDSFYNVELRVSIKIVTIRSEMMFYKY